MLKYNIRNLLSRHSYFKKGLIKEQLCEKLKISQWQLNNIIRTPADSKSAMSSDQLQIFASVLGVDLADILNTNLSEDLIGTENKCEAKFTKTEI